MAIDEPCAHVDLDAHIEDVHNLIIREDIRDVTLVGHSYGGLVITGVADRVPDRIERIVYLDAFVGANGRSFADLAPIHDIEALVVEDRIAPMIPIEKLGSFDREMAVILASRLVGQPWRTFAQSLHFSARALNRLPRAYIRTSDLIPEQAEHAMALGIEMIDARPAGHDAMLTEPAKIAMLLEQIEGLPVHRAEE
ncbi:pimeloyl-ACP methyl ester carboxylesterase [Sphingomonas sp. BE270]|jgi:pimeloyl-ACP methyl ester carboxylesterase|nr:putative esterase [Bradyrhizobium sp. BTAi1]MDR7259325.1 pimeloyl-ACP methyl ester carboxylesterase [Sphingomonas sp. BE270]